MAPSSQVAVDFNAMITADRQRRKNQALATEVFGKKRRSSAPGAGTNIRKPGMGPSLASRVGVTKRTVSTSTKPAIKATKPTVRPAAGNVDAEWTHDLHSLNNPSAPRGPRSAKPMRSNRNERLHTALNGSASSPALNSQFNVIPTTKPSTGISIRGLAGPYVVTAKNFAYGTTAADIESAMTPVGGVALSCRIIAERPSVIAEIVFETKDGADNVVETFNNQNADGNLLHVYHKLGGPARTLPAVQSAPVPSAARSGTPLGPRADIVNGRSDDTRSGYGGPDRYPPGERSRDRRRDYNSREEIVDGSYGFDDQMDTDDREDNGRGRGGLYSDSMVVNRGRRDRGRGNNRGRGNR